MFRCGTPQSPAARTVFYFHSSGRPDGSFRFDDLTTYDVNGMAAETLCGPPKGTLWCLPHRGASNRFQVRNGYWWSSMFCADQTGPWWARFGLAPLRVEKRPDGDLFVDVEDHPDDYQKRIMGGGEIAEVKTVQESLNIEPIRPDNRPPEEKAAKPVAHLASRRSAQAG